MRAQLERLFVEIFGVKVEEIQDSLSPKDTPEWNSLNMVLLITAVEKEFGVELSFDDLQRFDSFGSIQQVLSEKKKGGNNE